MTVESANEETSIRIGEFAIGTLPNGDFWIETAGGEGGQFNGKLLEDAIREFYAKHF